MRPVVLGIFVTLSIWLAAVVARAEEKPCNAVGSTVVCTREGFDILVRKYIDQKERADKCVLNADLRTSEQKVLEAKLALALEERDAARDQIPAFKPRTIFITGLVVGVVALSTLEWMVK